jgi:transcriptional regulatory protein RtcR
MKNAVAIGLLGPILDQGGGNKRWERWRPTVSICQQEDLLIGRFIILYQRRYSRLLKQVIEDIRHVSPETEVVPHVIEFDNPWDFEEVYSALHDFAGTFPFDPETEEYLVHITTGTHVAQICLFLLTESRHFPARLIQTSPSQQLENKTSGDYVIIDLDLSKYDHYICASTRTGRRYFIPQIGNQHLQPPLQSAMEQIERVATNSVDPFC